MNRILLVGVYAPAIPALKERTERLVRCPIAWEAVATAPEARTEIRNEEPFDIMVVGDSTPGLDPSAEMLVRLTRECVSPPRMIAIGPTLRDCKPLVLAGCENWCDLKELPELLRSYLISGAHVAS